MSDLPATAGSARQDRVTDSAASNGAFVWTPDEGRPGEENAALNEIDAGGRWRAARRAESATAAPRLPDGWLHERLREVLPEATDEQIDGLVALAEDYGRQLREARNV